MVTYKFKKLSELQRVNPKKSTPRHIKIKFLKTKAQEKILKVAREKQQGLDRRNQI